MGMFALLYDFHRFILILSKINQVTNGAIKMLVQDVHTLQKYLVINLIVQSFAKLCLWFKFF